MGRCYKKLDVNHVKNLRKGCHSTIPVNVRYRAGGKKALQLNNIKERC